MLTSLSISRISGTVFYEKIKSFQSLVKVNHVGFDVVFASGLLKMLPRMLFNQCGLSGIQNPA